MTVVAFAPAYLADAPSPRRRLSREATIAIGVSVAVHLGVIGYLATQKFVELKAPSYEDVHPNITVERLPPKTKPLPRTPKAPVPPIHNPDKVVTSEVPPLAVKPPDVVTSDPGPVAELPKTPEIVQIAELKPPPAQPREKVIRNPSWARKPTAREMGSLYPPREVEMGRGGAATIMCEVIADGSVRNCSVIDEAPKGRGFGEAALKSARLFKLNPRTVDGEAVEGAKVRIPLVFNLTD